MDLITDETEVEPTNELNEFLVLRYKLYCDRLCVHAACNCKLFISSCSPSSLANNSSIISTSDTSADSTSSPSSFESSFSKAVPESSPVVTEKYTKTLETLTLNVPDKPSELVECPQQKDNEENEVEVVIKGHQENGAVVEPVDNPKEKLSRSKLPTPSEKLKNCSALSSSVSLKLRT